METRVITLCYRKIIDVHSKKEWEKLVFEDTYREFKMQAQFFNQEKKYKTFAELIFNIPAAEKLHFLVSAAAVNYINQFKNKIPDLVNNIGKTFLHFERFYFEIINSDIRDRALHSVAINFYSTELIWYDTIGEYLLISDWPVQVTAHTQLFRIPQFVNIHSLQIK
ncbi:MAG: hypothetical protein QM768_23310 [Agriterribacter sp.]